MTTQIVKIDEDGNVVTREMRDGVLSKVNEGSGLISPRSSEFLLKVQHWVL